MNAAELRRSRGKGAVLRVVTYIQRTRRSPRTVCPQQWQWQWQWLRRMHDAGVSDVHTDLCRSSACLIDLK